MKPANPLFTLTYDLHTVGFFLDNASLQIGL